MRSAIASLLSAALLLSACARDDVPPTAEPTAPVAAKPVAEPVAEPAPVAVAEPTAGAEPAAAADYAVAVANVAPSGSLGDGQKLAVTAAPGENQIAVHVENLVTYCSPPPAFTAAVDGEVLSLTLVKHDNVSKCARPQRLDATVAVPGRNNLRRVVVLGHDGKELASATIGADAARCVVKGAAGECWDSTEAACEALGCAAGKCICTEATSNNTCACR